MDDADADARRSRSSSKLHHDKVGYPDKWRVVRLRRHARDLRGRTRWPRERFELHRQLAKVGKPVDRDEWGMTPPTVNAYYDPSMNEMVLPAGELQPPFFSRDFYAPVNIGDEGANTIGHELTHGFDDEGSQFDGDGQPARLVDEGDEGEVRGRDEVRAGPVLASTRPSRA